jgi:hypothetical protein
VFGLSLKTRIDPFQKLSLRQIASPYTGLPIEDLLFHQPFNHQLRIAPSASQRFTKTI